jgi:four helix bundle protein
MIQRTIKNYRDLLVWQKSMAVVVALYRATNDFPRNEQYGLTSQMRRCAVSIPSNIAEGRQRGSRKEYRHFLFIAYGSGAELETQLEIAQQLSFSTKDTLQKISDDLGEVLRMLNSLIQKLNI